MASSSDSVSMALFCDFENVALGVRDAKYEKFDIKRVLERLLLKGSIVVKKAYCDWDRYKSFKAAMHEANFELIEIPHVRQSGKNSADIRLVVDALDLCYTKSHVDTFVIISGDSDFSPLVSKLRENAKQVIGVGVKQSTSDLLIANCDEFIFYDDLVRDSQRNAAKREARDAAPQARRSAEEEKLGREELEARRTKAIDIAVETFEALLAERGESGKIWSSMLKEAIKRRKPDFNESYFGFRAFGNLLEEAQTRGLLELGRDEKSGTYVSRASGPAPVAFAEPVRAPRAEQPSSSGGGKKHEPEALASAVPVTSPEATPADEAGMAHAEPAAAKARRGRGRTRGAGSKSDAVVEALPQLPSQAPSSAPEAVAAGPGESRPASGQTALEPTVASAPAPDAVESGSPTSEEAAQHDEAAPNAAPKARGRSTRGRRSAAPKAEAVPEERAGSASETPAASPVQGKPASPAPSGEEAGTPARRAGSRAPRRTAAVPAVSPGTAAASSSTSSFASPPATEPAVKPDPKPRRTRKSKAEPAQ